MKHLIPLITTILFIACNGETKNESTAQTAVKTTTANHLTEAVLKTKSKEELRILRNEVFARKGYVFKSEDLNNYFKTKDWYQPDAKKEVMLSDEEQRYIEKIKAIEGFLQKNDFTITKFTEGEFMIGDYFEYFKITTANCKLTTDKSRNQVKYKIVTNSKKQGDWDNDGAMDFEFMFQLMKDGVTNEIVYAVISDCHYHEIITEFFYDEETFEENFNVSHIRNIKNAKDYYLRNFEKKINDSKINESIKTHMTQNFERFVMNENYKE